MLNKDRHGALLGTYEIVGQMAVVHMLNKDLDMAPSLVHMKLLAKWQ